MKIIVCIKQVGVLGDEVEFIDDETDVEPDFLDTALNEWDSYAVEEAILIRDNIDGDSGEVVVISVGDEDIEESMRRCLAMGADYGIRIEGINSHDPIAIAQALAHVIGDENPDIVFCGAQSADSVQSATPSALAALSNLPCICMAVDLDYNHEEKKVLIKRELEGGLIDTVAANTPAVISIQSGINEPRYATLRQIKKANQKEIKVVQSSGSEKTGYKIKRMYVPEKSATATLLKGDITAVASQISEIIQGKMK